MTVETFARDLWEALRSDLRDQLAGVISGDDFEQQVPCWKALSEEKRQEKIQSVRNELLRPITKAGYEIRRKI